MFADSRCSAVSSVVRNCRTVWFLDEIISSLFGGGGTSDDGNDSSYLSDRRQNPGRQGRCLFSALRRGPELQRRYPDRRRRMCPVHQGGYGMANYELAVPNRSDTRFHIASISKSFTAAAILMLQERGQLHMQDTLAKFIPDYPQGDKITLHHLLTHTSGIPNVNNLPTYSEKSLLCLNLTQIIPLFEDKPLEFQPGAFSLLQFQLQPARLYHRESLWERLWKVPRGKYLSASRNECHGQRRRIERPDSEPRFRICASRHAGCRKHPISELVDQDR